MYCADPFEVHKRKVLKPVRKVSKDVVQLGKHHFLTEGTPLCLRCSKMLKNPQSLGNIETHENTEDQMDRASVSTQDFTPNPTSHNTSTEEIVLGAEATKTVGEVLAALGQSPMRSSKF